MITPTHIVTNALVCRFSTRLRTGFLGTTSARRAFVIAGAAPDIPLYLLTMGAAAYYPLVRGMSIDDTFRLAFDDLFYTSPLWIIGQNTLHSPVVVIALFLLAGRGFLARLPWLKAFAAGCALHIAMDVPVHHNDGPLLLFPLNWDYRFSSPISYWDPARYGNVVAPIDISIAVLGSAVLLIDYLRRRRARHAQPAV
ncbi:MAG: metal-dependent hydrolase [Ornithinimicrobium sp.]